MQQIAQHPQPTNPNISIGRAVDTPPDLTQPTTSSNARRQEVHRIAGELYRQSPDWVTFFREVLGIEGAARRMFPMADEFLLFEKSQEYSEIQQMVAKLRENNRAQPPGSEPTRVITVRLPKSLHESLRTEAHERRTSMNKLCISKLLQVIDGNLIPHE